jgi:hypothetical protein
MAKAVASQKEQVPAVPKKKPGAKKPALKKPVKKDIQADADLSASLNSSLAIEMHHTRRLVREITHHFAGNLESGIVRSIELASEIPAGPKRNLEIQKILKQVRALQIIPEKGKLSDLRDIRDLVRSINSRLEDLL